VDVGCIAQPYANGPKNIHLKPKEALMELPLRMKTTILWSAAAAGAVGIPGAFLAHADVAVLVGIWTTLLGRLAYLSGEQLEKAKAAKIAAGAIGAIASMTAGVKLGTTYFAYTGVGTVPAIVVNAGANATLTYLFGKSAASIFMSEGTHESVAAIVKSIVALIIGRRPHDSDLGAA